MNRLIEHLDFGRFHLSDLCVWRGLSAATGCGAAVLRPYMRLGEKVEGKSGGEK
jgi:hypothetical protein